MTTVAPLLLAPEAETLDESVLAVDAAEPAPRVAPLSPRSASAGLSPRAFNAFVEEVAVHADLALELVGLDGQYEVSTDIADFGTAPGSAPDDGRAIFFEDGEGDQLPVYVSCGPDGLAFVAVARDDGAVLVVTDGHALGEIDDLVQALAAAIDREVPKPSFH